MTIKHWDLWMLLFSNNHLGLLCEITSDGKRHYLLLFCLEVKPYMFDIDGWMENCCKYIWNKLAVTSVLHLILSVIIIRYTSTLSICSNPFTLFPSLLSTLDNVILSCLRVWNRPAREGTWFTLYQRKPIRLTLSYSSSFFSLWFQR